MLRFVLISFATSLLLLSGCRKGATAVIPEGAEPPEVVDPAVDEGGPETKKGRYKDMLAKSRKDEEKLRAILSLDSSIRQFQKQIGRSPTNLVELVQKHYLDRLPTAPEGFRFAYDWEKGNVSQVPLNQRPMAQRGFEIKNTLRGSREDGPQF